METDLLGVARRRPVLLIVAQTEGSLRDLVRAPHKTPPLSLRGLSGPLAPGKIQTFHRGARCADFCPPAILKGGRAPRFEDILSLSLFNPPVVRPNMALAVGRTTGLNKMAKEAKVRSGSVRTLGGEEAVEWWMLMGYSQEAAERAADEEAAWCDC